MKYEEEPYSDCMCLPAANLPTSSISDSVGALPSARQESSSEETRLMKPFFQTKDSGKQGPTLSGSLQRWIAKVFEG